MTRTRLRPSPPGRLAGLVSGLVLSLVVCLPTLWAASPAAAEAAPKKATDDDRPNILLVVIDTLRADHLSAYGYERETSPRIDQLAEEGVLYEDSIASAAWTLPSHASLFTGLFPRDHKVDAEQWTLDERFETLADRLGDAGYRTAGFSNNVWTNDVSGLKQGFYHFREMFDFQTVRMEGISKDDPKNDMGARQTREEILEWVDSLPDDGRPFFVFVNLFEPHLPYRPATPFDGHWVEDVPRHLVQRLRSFYTPREYGYILRLPFMEVKPREIDVLTSLYDAEIAYTDHMLGRLVDSLEERGVLEDTVVIVTSDHGEHLGENHMLSHKMSVYEPLLRVPLILHNPKRLPRGVRIDTPVQNHDLYGTALELAGVRHHSKTLPLSASESGSESGDDTPLTFAQIGFPKPFLDVMKSKMPAGDPTPFERSLLTVRDGRYKLIEGSDGRVELFDLQRDPLEAKDLSEQMPKVVERLKKYLERFRSGELPDS